MKISFKLSKEEQKLLDFLRKYTDKTSCDFKDKEVPNNLKKHLHKFESAGIIEPDDVGLRLAEGCTYSITYLGVLLMKSDLGSFYVKSV